MKQGPPSCKDFSLKTDQERQAAEHGAGSASLPLSYPLFLSDCLLIELNILTLVLVFLFPFDFNVISNSCFVTHQVSFPPGLPPSVPHLIQTSMETFHEIQIN